MSVAAMSVLLQPPTTNAMASSTSATMPAGLAMHACFLLALCHAKPNPGAGAVTLRALRQRSRKRIGAWRPSLILVGVVD